MIIKELNLDVSKWRCGGGGLSQLGEGYTEMLNDEGFMCCLGQFYLQLGYDESAILQKGTPYDCGPAPLFTSENGHNSELTYELMVINDGIDTTIKTKIRSITEQLAKHGVKLNVVDPDNILGEH